MINQNVVGELLAGRYSTLSVAVFVFLARRKVIPDSPTTCIRTRLLLFLLVFWLVPTWTTAVGFQGEHSDESMKVESYLRSLDSGIYENREAALQGLSSLGDSAIRPLAIQIITGSPESAWRSKQAMEAIGIQGDEDTFLKTVGILKLLYLGASESLNSRIADLEVQWKLEQKRSILSQLKNKGARVVDSSSQLGINNPIVMWEAHDGIDLSLASSTKSNNRLVARRAESSVQRPMAVTIREVDQILNSTVDENRNRLFGAPRADDEAGLVEAQSLEIDPAILLELQMQRRFGVPIGGQLVGRNRGFHFDGIAITLDHQWRGKVNDLKRLSNLSELRQIEIDRISLPDDQVQELSNAASVVSVRIIGNEFDSKQLPALLKFPRLQDVELVDRKINSGELGFLGQVPGLIGLMLNKVAIAGSVMDELSDCKRLTSIALIDMNVAPHMMASLTRIPNLRMINLEVCKFEIVAYRELKRKRPEIEIGFTPQALLGVRDSINPSKVGCEISQVVPNSGADLGGMKAGDVVVRINGQPIEVFEDLRLHVAQHQAGDSLAVTVLRDERELELKVTLTHFEPVD